MTVNNIKTDILSAIGKTDDHNLKMVLLLMLGIMEDIGGKIDRIYSDKDLLRESVLNGHAGVHHDDHEWIKRQRESEKNQEIFMQRVEPVILWAEQKVSSEKENAKTVRSGIIEITIDILKKSAWIALGALALALYNH